MYVPLIMLSIRKRVLVGCDPSKGPTTNEGFTATRSSPSSSAFFQAACSPSVFANAYQNYKVFKVPS